MRLGGPVFGECGEPEQWVAQLQRASYRAAYWPLDAAPDDPSTQAFRRAADKADIVIAEVGAWSNPLSPDSQTRRAAVEYCQRQLALADAVGARCCLNITGSRGEQWDGPHPANLTAETFDMIVETARAIIDAVQPQRTYYTLETMPWAYPDSPDNYLRLIKAIDRRQFGVHLDPVNLICSPQRFFDNAALLHECFSKLGAHVKSCHAKDIALDGKLTVHLDEVRPGLGGLDYKVFLQELAQLEADVPLMLEHLTTEQEYSQAAEYICSVAADTGVTL